LGTLALLPRLREPCLVRLLLDGGCKQIIDPALHNPHIIAQS
jgi:hypothetical protein